MLGRRLGGTYQLERRLGAGGMGTVYRARHVRLDTGFAIKVLRPELTINTEVLARFHREARAAGQLKQPNIIDVFDVNKTEDGVHYIVQELLEGESLADHLRREGVLDLPRGIAILAQICDAMAAAHQKGIVHRDLKPENVFLCQEEERPGQFVKVLDFGIAKVLESGTQLTTPADIMGTPYFMAPEQAMGSGKADARSDIYSLGVIIYQMFTASLPFQDTDARALLALIQVKDPVAPRKRRPEISAALEEVILKAMDRDPDRRFQTMEQLKDVLLGLEDEEQATTPDTSRAITGPAPSYDELVSQPTMPAPGLETPAPTPKTPAPVAEVPPTIMHPDVAASTPERPEPAPHAPAPDAPDSFLKGQVEGVGDTPAGSMQDKKKVTMVFLGVVLVVAAAGGMIYYMSSRPMPPPPPARERVTGAGETGETDEVPAKPEKPTPDAAAQKPAAPEGMALVKGGAFTMGHDEGSKYERPAHPCKVADFYMDVREVTWQKFQAFLRSEAGAKLRARKPWAGKKEVPPVRQSLPVTGVTWAEADLYCRSQPGRELPSEAQWEYAARGPERAWLYPGGDAPPETAHANFSRSKKSAATLRQASAPLHGFSDLCGNAAEWVRDRLSVYTAKGCEFRKPPARAALARYRVIRGGGFDDHDPARLRATYRIYQDPKTFRWKSLGFRCVKEVKRP